MAAQNLLRKPFQASGVASDIAILHIAASMQHRSKQVIGRIYQQHEITRVLF